jgi:hypothetical protein
VLQVTRQEQIASISQQMWCMPGIATRITWNRQASVALRMNWLQKRDKALFPCKLMCQDVRKPGKTDGQVLRAVNSQLFNKNLHKSYWRYQPL